MNKAYTDAIKIFNLLNKLKDVRIFDIWYNGSNGALEFCFRSKPFIKLGEHYATMSCKITPKDSSTYSIIFYADFNICDRTILSEFDNVSENDLHSIFLNRIKFLDKEYENLDSWWGYGRMIRV